MKSSKRRSIYFISLVFILKCFTKPFISMNKSISKAEYNSRKSSRIYCHEFFLKTEVSCCSHHGNIRYRKISVIISELTQLRKGFWVGFKNGGAYKWHKKRFEMSHRRVDGNTFLIY